MDGWVDEWMDSISMYPYIWTDMSGRIVVDMDAWVWMDMDGYGGYGGYGW